MQQAQPAAAQNTSDVPPRGVEAPSGRAIAPPPDAGALVSDADAAPAGASDDDGPCSSAADCAITRVAKDECCEMLCEGRAVTKARAAELAGKVDTCSKKQGYACPIPLCRPPRFTALPACERGRCVARTAPID